MARGDNYQGEQNAMFDIYMDMKNQRYQIGSIESVNSDKGTMVVYVTAQRKYREVKINFGAINGPYHGLRTVPMKGCQVILAYESEFAIYHFATIPYKYQQMVYDVGVDNTQTLSMRKLRSGETELASCTVDGLPSATLTMLNRGRVELSGLGNNVLYLDPDSGMFMESQYYTLRGDTTRVSAGLVKRINANGDMEVKGTDGVPFTGIGSPLNEVYISLGQQVDSNDNDKVTKSDISVHISDQLLDDSGVPILSPDGKELQCRIKFSSGAIITVDKDGLINVGEANNIVKPTKNVARNGDQIEVPLMPVVVDPEHPGLTNIAVLNMAELIKLGPMIQSPAGPCVIVPIAGVTVNLKGEIIEGSQKMVVND
jgi:hypothetical protein